MKQLILYMILVNVLLVPWGLASTHRLDDVLIAIALLLVKALGVGLAVVVIESSFAKLRLYKIPEFTVASFLLAVLAVIIFVFAARVRRHAADRLRRHRDASSRSSCCSSSSCSCARRTSGSSFASTPSGRRRRGRRVRGRAEARGGDLYALGAVTIAFKALASRSPSARRAQPREPPAGAVDVGIPSAVLLGIVLSIFAFLAFARLRLANGELPLSALAVAVAVVVVAFLLMIVRPYAPSQLSVSCLENGVSLASLVIAPGLPLILALLLLFDVVVGLLVFVLLVQYSASSGRPSRPTCSTG